LGPGANLTRGSHGCVNVPKAAMATLYGWATVGTTLIVE
jgi:lipoprotein-anchoring transpeptidase ErfK/SrfK